LALEFCSFIWSVSKDDVNLGTARLELTISAQNNVPQVDPHTTNDLPADDTKDIDPGEQVDLDVVAPHHGSANTVFLSVLADDQFSLCHLILV
jgi:hypothetical protein